MIQAKPPLLVGGKLLLVGAGKMGTALLEGWLKLGLAPASVSVIDPSPAPDVAAMLELRSMRLNPPPDADAPPAVIVLAIKPQVLDGALPRIVRHVGPETLVVSIMAGKSLASLGAGLPAGTAIVRSMPNTPAAIGRGATVAVANRAVTAEQKAIAQSLLSASGLMQWIEDEDLMDAVTAVSGSGPAYVFLMVESLAKAGIAAGLPPDLALKLARQTVTGAGELLHQSDLPADALRRNVTSPGGTTAAALSVLMADDGLDRLMREAVAAAAERSRQLAD
jgi:pyrroline-5-carboxylate reductase